MSTSLAEAPQGGHIKEVVTEGSSGGLSSYSSTQFLAAKRKLAALNPLTAKRTRSPIVLPRIVRSPGVRQIISQNAIITKRSQAAGQRSLSVESPRARSLSPVARLASSPSNIPIELDVETQPRESSQSTPHVVTHRSGKRTLTSLIWKEFKPFYSSTSGKVLYGKCMHCNKVIKANRGSGTSQCHRHLLKCPLRIRVQQLVESLHSSLSPDASVLKDWKFDPDVARAELLRIIVLQELPFSFVEHTGFRRFCASLNPYFRVVSRTTIKDDCLAAYHEQKLALFEALRKINSRVSLTADMWSSNQNLGYMCMTCHFVDNEWNMQKRIIRFTQVRTPHDSIALFNEILKCIQDWHIESKLFSITLDNASVNDSMVVDLKANLLGKLAMPCKGELFHFRCAAHILNLIVQDGLSTISGAISRIRESVKYIRASEAREQKFEEMIAQVGIVEEKRPSLDVSTRWNSTYLMLSSSLLFRRAFDSLDRFDASFQDAPLSCDWENAEILCKHLKIFYDATVVVSGTSYPTVTRYFHEFWKVKEMLLDESNSEDVLVASMVSKMDTKFQKYWDLQFLQICVPVVFDPRFKFKFLEFRLKAGFGDKAIGPSGYLSRIKRTVRNWFAEYSSQISGPSTNNSQEASTIGVNVGGSQFADWRQYLHDQSKSKIKTELTRYLEDIPQENDFPYDDFDILQWWRVNSCKYPILSRMALDLLAVPASSVASESAFSTGSRIISDYRSRLASGTVEALICLQDWMRADGMEPT